MQAIEAGMRASMADDQHDEADSIATYESLRETL
jgi:hypothetical protein